MAQNAPSSLQKDLTSGADRVRFVKEFLHTLTKTAKAVKLYSETHHLVVKFLKDLEQSIANSLRASKTITLEVTDTEFVLGDEVVYEQKSQEGNFAFRLYKDGIRRLIIKSKPSTDELRRFLSILGTPPNILAQTQEDMVSLLWKAELKSIAYKAIDGFSEMMMGDPQFGVEYNETITDVLPGFGEVLSQDEEEWGDSVFRVEAPTEALDEGVIQRIDERVAKLLPTQMNLSRVQRVLMQQTGDQLFEHMAAVLLRALYRPDNPIAPSDAVSYFDRLLGGMIRSGALASYLRTTYTLEVLFQRPQLLPGELPIVFKRILAAISSTERLIAILRFLKKVPEEQLIQLGQFFLRNGQDEVGKLREQVDEEIPEPARELLLGLLAALGQDQIDTWMELLAGDDEEKAVDALHCIVEQIEPDKSIPIVRRTLRHDLPGLRVEAARILTGLDPKAHRDPVLSLLKDPAQSVRLEVLPLLSHFGTKDVGSVLLAQLRSKDFHSLGEEERCAWVEATARPGQDSFVGPLAQLMEFKEKKGLRGLFSRKGMDLTTVRQAVLDSLFAIGTAAAGEVVSRAKREGSAEIRTHCESFDLLQKHKELIGDEGEESSRRTTTVETVAPARHLKLVPVPSPEPSVERPLLLPVSVFEHLAPSESRYRSVHDIPDQLSDEALLDERISSLARRPVLEGIRRGAELQDLELELSSEAMQTEAWTLEPVSAQLYVAPGEQLFFLSSGVPSPAAATARPQPAGEGARTPTGPARERTPTGTMRERVYPPAASRGRVSPEPASRGRQGRSPTPVEGLLSDYLQESGRPRARRSSTRPSARSSPPSTPGPAAEARPAFSSEGRTQSPSPEEMMDMLKAYLGQDAASPPSQREEGAPHETATTGSPEHHPTPATSGPAAGTPGDLPSIDEIGESESEALLDLDEFVVSSGEGGDGQAG